MRFNAEGSRSGRLQELESVAERIGGVEAVVPGEALDLAEIKAAFTGLAG